MKEDSRLAKLNELYREAEECDRDVFADQRSNIMLVSGEHYAKTSEKIWKTLRTRTDVSPEQKIRLTRNHIQRVCKIYKNNILSAAPGVGYFPNNEGELQDKKSAELMQSVWDYAKIRYRLKEKIKEYVQDFNDIGEVAVKVFFDPLKGDLVGYEQAVDAEGNPVFEKNKDGTDALDEQGQPIPVQDDKRPVFTGDFVFEKIYAFNLLRDPNAESMHDSPYLIVRKMVAVKDLKARYKDDEEKSKIIQEEQDKTFVVFDGQNGKYGKSKGQTMLREFYYRPCHEYPNGYYYFAVENGILEEGELPLGVFPIAYSGAEKVQTSARHRSPIKHMRPYQIEINRCASKMAEHQITLGDDKIVTRNGAKLEQDATFAGIRSYKSSGDAPVVIAGRDGSQYLGTLQQTISELYDVMGVDEKLLEKSGDLDAYQLIFRSAAQKKQFSDQIERFEQFLIDLSTIFMKLAREYYDDNTLIPMIGRREYVNIEEFRGTEELAYKVKVQPVSEDVETVLGKQLVLSQAIQYGSSVMTREDFGKIVQNMPFTNAKDIFSDLTLNSRVADNVLLALDRGEKPVVNFYDPHPYMINRLTARMREPDFKMLSPEIQANYDEQVQLHEQAEAEKQAQLMAAKNEFIPTSGAMVACDIYVQDPKNPLSNKRARVPYDALNWLIQKMELQGNSLERLEQLSLGSQVNVLSQAAAQQQQGAQGQPAQPSLGAPQQPAPGLGQA